ncbi:MAG TPA: phosphoribosylaminoimidazolesuccinocarboxamide synthase [Gemmatimonadales bacterium]|nr:phosphoribosylaminoimidazolesuccinocarboxamide synthase [Gemmatimonadales bacterium]
MTVLAASRLPLPLWRTGKVREVYEFDAERLLLVTSDRVSAFDVVMREPVPWKGAVLTQLSAFWFRQLDGLGPHHYLTADADEIVAERPALAPHRDELFGRAMLVRRTAPVAFECVVRGYLSGSAWQEYKKRGTLAGEPLPAGMTESARFPAPIFSPATKAETGHDENVTEASLRAALGPARAAELRERSTALFAAGNAHAEQRGIIIADTKFEFGVDPDGTLRLIDEVLTPDSSRFWPADRYVPGRSQPSFDKQPLRDYLAGVKAAGEWNGDAPPPPLPAEVVAATSARYLEAYRLITGTALPGTA